MLKDTDPRSVSGEGQGQGSEGSVRAASQLEVGVSKAQ